ncbi:UDP-3-O-(3-hydroxymyristoyl)glucosamine N-acyltransferase [Marinobacterium jannaschii]|uniref:UDP-3-O-(3-hydroxymyristoyl)glucosamine N-acyltransferase n=1 Tax=Marinobacterium jannaschii TaxID=64970 RepID=UPI0004890926|nr:UDP-3-O-(3-hydroxymyristoyl)glucosamine N-acyltransferase [Marinobacterium jannaschii]
MRSETSCGDYTLAELAGVVGADVAGSPDFRVSGIATLKDATSDQLAFFANSRYLSQLHQTSAGAVLVAEQHRDDCPVNALVVEDPYLAYAKLSSLFAPRDTAAQGIHPSATVDPTATIDAAAVIGANVVVGADTEIAAGCVVGANTVIAERCNVAEGTHINPGVTLYADVKIGRNCIIHSGAVIGADGFGFANEKGRWVKIAQLGGVTLGDDVEVGANTTIDRGALSDTLIGSGVKLDNQIQIAHNVEIGDSTAIAGCTAVAGSTKIGDRCTIAGCSGITGHLEIASGTHITAMTLVSKSITGAGAYSSGTTAEPHSSWKKNVVRFRQLDNLAKRLKVVEAKLDKFEGHN